MFYKTTNELTYREKNQNPVKIAIAGTGFIGRGLMIQLSFMDGVRLVAVSNRNIEKALLAIKQMKGEPTAALCTTAEEVKCIKPGDIAVTTNPLILVESDADVIIDLTGDTFLGAELGMATIQNNKHFVASAEMDITVGPYLNSLAKRAGLVYSGADGDEPGVIMRLYNWARVLGLEIVAAGKFKGYTNMYSTPYTVKPWAEQAKQNPYKISSFADGSKMSIEMGLVANATGLIPDICGMHLPEGTLETVTSILCDKKHGGILSREGVVEVVSGVKPGSGVYVVAKVEHPQIISDLKYYKMGNGPYYMFYRPYHLCSFEMAAGIVEMVLHQEPVICPLDEAVADVVTFAKKDLEPGDVLDTIGGFTFTGKLDTYTNARNMLPIGLAPGAKIIKSVQKGEAIQLEQVRLDEGSTLFKLKNIMNDWNKSIQLCKKYITRTG